MGLQRFLLFLLFFVKFVTAHCANGGEGNRVSKNLRKAADGAKRNETRIDKGGSPYSYKRTPLNAVEIINCDDVIILKCDGELGSELVSWWFYPCPKQNRPVDKLRPYEIVSSRSGGMLSSSLRLMKSRLEDVSGLYRCEVTTSFLRRQFLGKPQHENHYFIVGRKKSLGNCFNFPGVPNQGQSLIEDDGYRGVRTYEYILRLPYNSTRAHSYKIRFSLFAGQDLGRRGIGDDVENPNRVFENLDVIPFEMSDAVNPFQRFIQGHG